METELCQELGHQSGASLYFEHVLAPQSRMGVRWSPQPDFGMLRLVQQYVEARGLKGPLLTEPAEPLVDPRWAWMPQSQGPEKKGLWKTPGDHATPQRFLYPGLEDQQKGANSQGNKGYFLPYVIGTSGGSWDHVLVQSTNSNLSTQPDKNLVGGWRNGWMGG